MTWTKRWIALSLVIVMGFLLGILGFSIWDQPPAPVERVAWSPEVRWIAPPETSYRLYARRTFYTTDTVQAAWLRLSADNDFVFYVNGQSVVSRLNSLSNPNRLASGFSDYSQSINDSIGYRDNGVIKYMLSHTNQWKLAVYINLAPYLQSGKNVIALEVQKGQPSPRVVIEGVVNTGDGKSQNYIDLSTGVTPWQTATLSHVHQGLTWYSLDFPDQDWPVATSSGPVKEATYSRLSPQVFNRTLQGNWISGVQGDRSAVWLRGIWQVPQRPKRAYVRFSGDGQYSLLINNSLVKRFTSNRNQELNIYEVSNYLRPGRNTLAVQLISPLDSDSSQSNLLAFFLDGWVETDRGSITETISTNSTWSTISQPTPDWLEGYGQDQPVNVIGQPNPEDFKPSFLGNANLLNVPNYFFHISSWILVSIVLSLGCAWVLGRLWHDHRDNSWNNFEVGAGLLLPGTFFLIGIGLLKHRYALAEEGLLFAQPSNIRLTLLVFAAILLITLLWCKPKADLKKDTGLLRKILHYWGLWFVLGLIVFNFASYLATKGLVADYLQKPSFAFIGCIGIVTSSWLWQPKNWKFKHVNFLILAKSSWLQWLALSIVLIAGLGLRLYNLDAIDLDNDENTSLDAIRGILRTGTPEAKSGILYTRGPLFHYTMALWLKLVGYSPPNARLLIVLFGTLTLFLFFLVSRQATGKVWLSLLVTALLAIDPWELYYSRNIRFYQPAQFASLLALFFFTKGFINRSGRIYQYFFFLALGSMLLIQEVNIVLIPGYLIGFLIFYRPFDLKDDWPIIVSAATVMISYAINGFMFSVLCLTPWVSLSANVSTQLKLRVWDVTSYISHFFLDSSRLYPIYSFFFALGFLYFLLERNGRIIFLFSLVIIHTTLLTFMAPGVAGRYTYASYPLLILLSVYSAIRITIYLSQTLGATLQASIPLRNISVVFLTLLLASNIQPEKVLASYGYAINRQYTQVFQYIQDHRQPGDIVIANVSSTSVNVLDKLDYVFPTRGILPLDTVYLHDGRLIDRWSGAVALTNLDQVSHVLSSANRVWIQLDDHVRPGTNPELIRIYNYFQTFGKPAYETFGTRIRLWEKNDGELQRVPNRGQDLGVY